jgi:hypothetical protein
MDVLAISAYPLEAHNFTRKGITMEKIKRCPICNLAVIPKEVFAIWKDKFGTDEKPHHTAVCRICGKTAGEHFGTSCSVTVCNECNTHDAEVGFCLRCWLGLIDKTANLQTEIKEIKAIARKVLLCFSEEIPKDQEELTFNIPAYIIKELRDKILPKPAKE